MRPTPNVAPEPPRSPPARRSRSRPPRSRAASEEGWLDRLREGQLAAIHALVRRRRAAVAAVHAAAEPSLGAAGSHGHLLAGLAAFEGRRYAAAEGCYWRTLDLAPGDPAARAFLAETLIAQRRLGEAERVLVGLARLPGQDPALAFAGALRQGFEAGLFAEDPLVLLRASDLSPGSPGGWFAGPSGLTPPGSNSRS